MLIPPLILLNTFVVLVMFSIGLRVRGGELLDVLRGRSILIRTLLANCILIPAIGFLLISIFPLTRDAMIGLLLLAAIPGTPIAMQFTSRVESRLAFAAGMTAVLSVVSIIMAPLAVQVFPEASRQTERPILFVAHSDRFIYGNAVVRWIVGLPPRTRDCPQGGVAAWNCGNRYLNFSDVGNAVGTSSGYSRDCRTRDHYGDNSVAALVYACRLDDRRRRRHSARIDSFNQYAQRCHCAVYLSILLSGNQCLYGPDRLSIDHGARKYAVLPCVCGMAPAPPPPCADEDNLSQSC